MIFSTLRILKFVQISLKTQNFILKDCSKVSRENLKLLHEGKLEALHLKFLFPDLPFFLLIIPPDHSVHPTKKNIAFMTD